MLDHLVIACRALEDGLSWCQATLGILPDAGGAHPHMGTHNRIFSIASDAFPAVYAEILAIDPAAPPPGRPRWFGLDDPVLSRALERSPLLVGFAARVDDLPSARAQLVDRGLDPGRIIGVSRATPRGLLEWTLTVRDDGRRQLDGVLPVLIGWGAVHPSDSLAPSGVALRSVVASHPRADELRPAFAAIGLDGVELTVGPARLTATLDTPRGVVALASA